MIFRESAQFLGNIEGTTLAFQTKLKKYEFYGTRNLQIL